MISRIKYSIQNAEKLKENLPSVNLKVSESGNMHIVHKAITKQLHKKRQGSASCKSRSEVSGGGKKPWKQKGTGKARAGSNRSPLWKGGGVIFGPKTKKYNQKVNKKECQLAIRNMLFNKQNSTFAIKNSLLNLDQPKTKLLLKSIKQLNIETGNRILIIMAKKEKNVLLAARNLKNIEIIAADQLNLLSIIKTKLILIEINAIKIVADTYNG